MRVTRAFVDAALSVGTRITLPDSAAQHLVRVLRLRVDDTCVLFNGDGRDYQARIVAAGKRDAAAEILGVQDVDRESPLGIVLLQGIARGEKMDLILQKATELGVSRIVPVDAERTEVRLEGDRLQKRVAHWRSVVVSACEQSGRARIPDVEMPASLGDAVRQQDAAARKLTLDPFGEQALASVSDLPGAGVVLAVGPEGGWSPGDRTLLAAGDFVGMRLGPRILRTETAGLAAIAVLQALHGDFRR